MGESMKDRSKNLFFLLASLILLGMIPLILPVYYVGLVTRSLIMAVLALSVNFLLGYLGLASVGHAVFMGISSYAVAIYSRQIGMAPWPAMGTALLAAILAGAFFGLLAIRTKGIFFLVIMLAFCQVLYGTAFSWRSLTGGDDGLPGLRRPLLFSWLSLEGTVPYYCFVVFVFLGILAGFWLLVNSPFGLTLKGIRESESRMRVLGYNVWHYKYLAFIISGGMGGVAGILHAYYDGCPNPSNFGLVLSSTALLMVILGGPGTCLGPVIGALIIVFLQDIVSGITERWFMVLGAAYVMTVLLCPQGIIGALGRISHRGLTAKTKAGD
jgi:branched-chain amino acid transport system permease protein